MDESKSVCALCACACVLCVRVCVLLSKRDAPRPCSQITQLALWKGHQMLGLHLDRGQCANFVVFLFIYF